MTNEANMVALGDGRVVPVDPSGNYPKAATTTLQNGAVVPVVYPPGHIKAGLHVVFANAAEERDYDNSGVPGSAGPEQKPQSAPAYLHGAWHIVGVSESPRNR